MKTQSFFCRPRLFQRVGKTSNAILQVAIGIMAVALSSKTVWAISPWFSGYMNSTNSYRIYAFTDWDTTLMGAGILPDSDCLGIQPPSYRVDGHVVWEADGTGNCIVIEATGSYSVRSDTKVGSIFSVSIQHSQWFNSPSLAPASDTRADYSNQFLNILDDPVAVNTNAPPLYASVAVHLAPPTIALSWSSNTNQIYQLEWTYQLSRTNTWYFLGNSVIGNGTTNIVYDSTTNSTRFYRVITLQ
jgi:hypothetical protein